MRSTEFAAFAICAALLLSFSGCVSIVDDTQGAQQAAPSLPQPPSPPSAAPSLVNGKVPPPTIGGPYLNGSSLPSALELIGRMMGGNSTNLSLPNESGDASQLALIQRMMANSSAAGGLNAQQLALVQQMMAGNGGNGGMSAQQLALLQQMIAGSGGANGMSAEQLAALQRMMANSSGMGGYNQPLPPENSPPADGSAAADATQVAPPKAKGEVNVTYFYKPGCPYCAKVAPLISQMKKNFAEYGWKEVNVETSAGYAQFDAAIRGLGLPDSYYVVPFVTVNGRALVGVSEISDSLPGVLAGMS